MDKYNEDIFDEKVVTKAIKKGKRKTITMVILISVIVFIGITLSNFFISIYFSQKSFKQWDAYVRLSTPNGYISETVDTRGFLGGVSHYKVAKDMGIKSIVLEQKQYQFGLSPMVLMSRGSGGNIAKTGEDWQSSYKENGWRDLMFFHPEVSYEKYKNDEEVLRQMPDGKIYEVALSFDQSYKINELPMNGLPEMSWFWVNSYHDEELSMLQQEAEEHDWSATFINENEALGFSIHSPTELASEFEYKFADLLQLLQDSNYLPHKETYKFLKEKEANEIEILGVVVYGTKSEILEMVQHPSVKASSIGGIVDDY